MPAGFLERKAKILADLAIPDAQYHDSSPKGTVDSEIRELISDINALPEYVTTSSCAGRITVYLEGFKAAKGGGRWLFASHSPINIPREEGSVFEMFGLARSPLSVPPQATNARFVHLKFEPLVGQGFQHRVSMENVSDPLYPSLRQALYHGPADTLRDLAYSHSQSHGCAACCFCCANSRFQRERYYRHNNRRRRNLEHANGRRSKLRPSL
ncbi:hypothetical protein BAUCODRAFT_564046 [Baudoinia panamericana UAMH 10762]|uniref:tRNA(Phe) 7-[(3-amino-3-carboxypropyl)-4-demethylwyosine(37)-N(4)]-methyltransferase n=1 Tax=Baudoinia panamericana (strain UAMH 10762) TaxID=717646 RepID=M2N6X3_BAUPA|nr:uncharacterized protein BAUCODRAFT_564046 [Baudoinia panamericana UAMH 10762]EMC94839.1 hypothetical protein BAUCODRAFT_564046 [Baudoinia panamericana UAMH 10762]